MLVVQVGLASSMQIDKKHGVYVWGLPEKCPTGHHYRLLKRPIGMYNVLSELFVMVFKHVISERQSSSSELKVLIDLVIPGG